MRYRTAAQLRRKFGVTEADLLDMERLGMISGVDDESGWRPRTVWREDEVREQLLERDDFPEIDPMRFVGPQAPRNCLVSHW